MTTYNTRSKTYYFLNNFFYAIEILEILEEFKELNKICS
jgi:hypothetical protein